MPCREGEHTGVTRAPNSSHLPTFNPHFSFSPTSQVLSLFLQFFLSTLLLLPATHIHTFVGTRNTFLKGSRTRTRYSIQAHTQPDTFLLSLSLALCFVAHSLTHSLSMRESLSPGKILMNRKRYYSSNSVKTLLSSFSLMPH